MARKKKTKTRRSLTISIHGHDLDIKAKIGDSGLADTLAEAIRRVTSTRADGTSAPSPLAELIREFGKSLRKEQHELLMNSLDMSQKLIFMEIMNTATSEQANN